MLETSCRKEIAAMAKGKSLLRVGDIWYGTNRWTTVSGIYHFSNKNVVTRQAIRAEAAVSFSNSMPAIDTVQVELVIHYSAIKSHLQRLFAELLITPVLPVMNPVIAALTMPITLNRDVYRVYGLKEEYSLPESDNPPAGMKIPSFEELMGIYSRVPIQMRVELAQLSTIEDASRDVRVILRFIRVQTANSYGEKPLYLRRLEDAVVQDQYLAGLLSGNGDNEQITALASMIGIDANTYSYMINAMKAVLEKRSLSEVSTKALSEQLSKKSDTPVDTGDAKTFYTTRDFPGRLILHEDKRYVLSQFIGREIQKSETRYDPADPLAKEWIRTVELSSVFGCPDGRLLDMLLCYTISPAAPEVYFKTRMILDRYIAPSPSGPLYRAVTGTSMTSGIYRANPRMSLPYRVYQSPRGLTVVGYPGSLPLEGTEHATLVAAYKVALASFREKWIAILKEGEWNTTVRNALTLRFVTREILTLLFTPSGTVPNPYTEYAEYYRTTLLGESS